MDTGHVAGRRAGAEPAGDGTRHTLSVQADGAVPDARDHSLETRA
jgi:hypothetical protein